MPTAGDELNHIQNAPTNVKSPQDWTLFCQSLERLSQHVPSEAYGEALQFTKCHTTAILLGAITTIEESNNPAYLSNRLHAEIQAHRASQGLYYEQAQRNERLERENTMNDRLLKATYRDRDKKRSQIRDLDRQLQITDRDLNELQSQVNDLYLALRAKDSRIEIDRRQAQSMKATIKELIDRVAERESEIQGKDQLLHELQEQNDTAAPGDQASEE
ncbi:MAG: hypothetical protein Q9160_008192 [Pyrenula sp. 1 TL-2023]